MPANLTIDDSLIDEARRVGRHKTKKDAVTAALRDDPWSYRRLWRAANAVASHLRQQQGLCPGDRVLVWGPNSPQLVATYFGAMLARLVLVPLDPYSTKEFMQRVADKTQAASIITAGSAPATAGPLTKCTCALRFWPSVKSGSYARVVAVTPRHDSKDLTRRPRSSPTSR